MDFQVCECQPQKTRVLCHLKGTQKNWDLSPQSMLHTKHKVKQGLTTEVQTRTSSKFKSFGSETNNRFESWAGPGYAPTARVHAEGKSRSS